MASVVDQRRFAERAFASFGQATDLKKRLWFTLGALIVYRLGTYIPLPGIDPVALKELFDQQQGGILGMFNMFSGGALSRMTVFALNILPYISSSIIMQLLAASVPSLEQLKKEGEAGRRKITQYTRYGTVLLAALQGYGIAVGLENSGGVVLEAGVFFRLSTVVSIVGGTMFLMWLGEQITQRGVGNGISFDHLLGNRCKLADSPCGYAGAGTHGSAVDGVSFAAGGDDHRRYRRDRFCRAGAAAFGRALSETPTRRAYDGRRIDASSFEAEHLRRDSAHLCKFDSAHAP